jgi:thymidylate synthase
MDLNKMALPPCAFAYNFAVTQNGYLNCHLIQRSGDMGLGVPFNIASASLLTHILAHLTGYKAGELYHTVWNAHVYENHIGPLETQIQRPCYALPLLKIDRGCQRRVEDFRADDFKLHGYFHHDPIKMEMAV